MQRPLLFLDVDGTLLPFASTGRQMDDDANPLLAGLDPEHGRRLAALPCDLVWATTWMAEANEVLAPRLGLLDLPIVDWPDDEDDNGRLHWKTRHLVEWAAGRRFVWVDDEVTDADRNTANDQPLEQWDRHRQRRTRLGLVRVAPDTHQTPTPSSESIRGLSSTTDMNPNGRC